MTSDGQPGYIASSAVEDLSVDRNLSHLFICFNCSQLPASSHSAILCKLPERLKLNKCIYRMTTGRVAADFL